MDSYLLGVLLLIVVAGGAVYMTAQTKKGYLIELQKELGLQDFSMRGGFGEAQVRAKWKGMAFTIVAQPQFTLKPVNIIYKTECRFNFIADITAGVALSNAPISTKEKKDEEKAIRPWQVKLTAEEQKIIDERRGTAISTVSTEQNTNKLNLVTNRVDEATKFLNKNGHSEVLENLFKAGISAVKITMTEIMLIKQGYDNNDMLPIKAEQYLKGLKELLD